MRRLTGALALAALLLTGCPAAQLDPQEAVVQAAERTSEAGTARLVMTVEQAGLDMTMTMEGTTDFDNGRAEMLMMLPGMPPDLADGIRMIVDGTVVYTQMPMPGQPVQWVRLDAAEMMGAAGGGTPGGQNPADTLDFLRGVSDDVTEAGSEQVRGTQTTRYDGTVDLNRAIKTAPEEQRELMRQTIEMLGTAEMPVSVWVDDEGLLRRLRYDMDLSQAQTPDGARMQALGEMTVTMELFDFGVEVDITPPPEDEVVDFQDLGLPTPTAPPA